MSKYISILGIFCLLTNSNLLAGAKGIWAGQSGAFDFQWTTHDVTVSPIAAPSKILYSAARLFRKGHQKTQEAAANEQTLRILSIVGPVMSVETYDYSDYLGTAHPSLYSRYTAIDFRRPDRMARLGDYFPHEDIRMALLRDKLLIPV